MINIDNIGFWHVIGTFFLISGACRKEFGIDDSKNILFFRVGVVCNLLAFIGYYKPWSTVIDYLLALSTAILLSQLVNKSKGVWWFLTACSAITGYCLSLCNSTHHEKLMVGLIYWAIWICSWLYLRLWLGRAR